MPVVHAVAHHRRHRVEDRSLAVDREHLGERRLLEPGVARVLAPIARVGVAVVGRVERDHHAGFGRQRPDAIVARDRRVSAAPPRTRPAPGASPRGARRARSPDAAPPPPHRGRRAGGGARSGCDRRGRTPSRRRATCCTHERPRGSPSRSSFSISSIPRPRLGGPRRTRRPGRRAPSLARRDRGIRSGGAAARPGSPGANDLPGSARGSSC